MELQYVLVDLLEGVLMILKLWEDGLALDVCAFVTSEIFPKINPNSEGTCINLKGFILW